MNKPLYQALKEWEDVSGNLINQITIFLAPVRNMPLHEQALRDLLLHLAFRLTETRALIDLAKFGLEEGKAIFP